MIPNQNQASVIIKDPHLFLLNISASCLLNETRYYDDSDSRKDLILTSLNTLADIDPEFILQLARYLRKVLYIRTTTNFILAFAGAHPKTQKFVGKYFSSSILLPSDLIEVSQFYQLFRKKEKGEKMEIEVDKEVVKPQPELEIILPKVDPNKDFRYRIRLSKTLRKAIKERFKGFSIYQLGKYCSEGRRKAQLKKYKIALNGEKPNKKNLAKKEISPIKKKVVSKKKFIAYFKKLGKKYYPPKPLVIKQTSQLTFLNMKDLVRVCNMKQPVLNVLSILGKKYPQTIEDFNEKINKNDPNLVFDPLQVGKRLKVPIPKTWETELSSIGNKPAVWESLLEKNSLPYMAMMRNLRNIIKSGIKDEYHKKCIDNIQKPELVANAKMFPFQYFSALSTLDQMEKDVEVVDKHLFPMYKIAVDQAIKTSIDKNLPQLKGHTVIFADVSGSMSCPISGGKTSYGSVRTCKEAAILLGLMIRLKCEKCTYFIFSSPGQHNKCYLEVNLEGFDILANTETIKRETCKLGGGTDFPYECIKELQEKEIKVDKIIILSDMMISPGHQDIQCHNLSVNSVINNYRNDLNPQLKVFSVDLRGYGMNLNLGDEFNDENFIRIYGMSDGILKFIAFREDGKGQIDAIKSYQG